MRYTSDARPVVILAATLLWLSCVVPSSSASEFKRLAIFPFKINAQQDLSFLVNGIADMLDARLDKGEQTIMVDRDAIMKATKKMKGAIDEARAVKLSKRLNADIAIFGSLTVFGSNLSFDAKMIDTTGRIAPVAYSKKGSRLDDVIDFADEFAAQVGSRLFPASAAAAPIPRPSEPSPGIPAPVRVPPVRVEPVETPTAGSKTLIPHGKPKDGPASTFTPYEEVRVENNVAQLKRFKTPLNGIAIGDIDGDGLNETVVITESAVHAVQYQGKRMVWSRTLFKDKLKKFKGIDVADINGNGFAEIFISSLDFQEAGVSSLVLEFNGKRFAAIVDESPWYYRAIREKDGSYRLFGQKDASYHPFAGKIHELAWQDKTYAPHQPIPMPRQVSLMGFATGDVMNDGSQQNLSFNTYDRIQLSEASGRRIWQDGKPSGGSTLFFKIPQADTDGPVAFSLVYYPTRLWIHDVDGDGLTEVVTIMNHETLGRRLESRRKFKRFFFDILAGNGTALAGKYKTPVTDGHAIDFSIADYNNDGAEDLVAAMVIGNPSMIKAVLKGEPGSGSIIAYPLPGGKGN